jgi:hypothetical protein
MTFTTSGFQSVRAQADEELKRDYRSHHLPPDVRWTYLCHWVFSALSGVTAGVLTNAQVIGIKVLGAANWHLGAPTQ